MSYNHIQTITVTGSAASSIDFTSIPQTYDTLEFIVSVRSSAGSSRDECAILFNGDGVSGAGTYTYYSHKIQAYDANSVVGESVSSNNPVGANHDMSRVPGDTTTANTRSALKIIVPAYTNSSYKKTAMLDWGACNNSTSEWTTGTSAVTWDGTAAISRATFKLSGSNLFMVGSLISVYGIKNS